MPNSDIENQSPADSATEQSKSKKRGMSMPSRPRIVKFNINPIFLIVALLLITFVGYGLLNRGSSYTPIQVDELMRGVKENRFSGLQIQDDGNILVQDKYINVATVPQGNTASLSSPSVTKVTTSSALKTISLADLISEIKPADPLTQLRQLILGNGSGQISELIIGQDFVIVRNAGAQTTDQLVANVSEDDLATALRDQGLDIKALKFPVSYLRNASSSIDYNSFAERAKNGEFAAVVYVDNKVYGRIQDELIPTYSITWDGGIRAFADTLQGEGVSLSSSNIAIGTLIVPIVPWGDIISLATLIGFVILAFFLFRGIQGSGSSLMRFGQSKARMFWGAKQEVTFKDVAGIAEAKHELEEIVEFLRNPTKFTKLGARIPKGVLMVGAPGTGKTLLARAIAGEAGVPFFHTSGSEFEEMLVGAGASRVRDLFEKAKKAAPSLIFIDEIDAVARKRGTTVQSSTTEQTLNQILVEMDGFEQGTNVIVIAATNRPDVLDPAILRPGRFDRRVVLDLPDIQGRMDILKIHAKNKPLAADVNMEKVAKRTVGFSGAELENMLNEAAIIAAMAGKSEISYADIEEAASKVTLGPTRRSRKRTQEELHLVSIHEAGHAVVSKFVKLSYPVHRVSILSRGMAGGVTEFLPEDDNPITSRTRLLSRIVVALGGRAAEQVVLNDISTGASSDIDQVTNIVRNMVQKFGMSEKLGLIKYGESNDLQYLGYGYGEQRDYSDETAKLIDEEVRRIVKESYDEAIKILTDHRDLLDKLTQMLLDKEVVEGDEFDKLFHDAPKSTDAKENGSL